MGFRARARREDGGPGVIKTSNAGRQDEPRGEHHLAQRVTGAAAHGPGTAPRRLLTLASIASVLVGLVTVATHPLSARAALFDINVFAGNGCCYGGDGGPATSAQLNQPSGVAEDSAGNVFIADANNNVIRKVDTSGIITTYAGNGSSGFAGDGGAATSAQLSYPEWLSFDAAGDLLIADTNNNRIRAVTTSGTITTVAGNGTAGYTGDGGAATSAELNGPQTVRGLPAGGFLLGDSSNNVVRKVDASGNITTIAGNGTGGYSGDGGAATSAQLNSPEDAVYDATGNLFIADCSNQRIRKVDPTGNISTFAGTGTAGFSGDGGPAASAQFDCPNALVSAGGALFVGDYGNGAIRKIDVGGTITTIAGQGHGGINNSFTRVGQAWIDTSGKLFFTDWWEDHVYVQSIADLLSVTAAAPAAVASGQTFPYTLTVSNPGGAGTATGVTLSDPLPAGVTFVNVTASAGTCSQSGGTVSCALGTLNPGDVVTVTITVTAPSATVQLSNTATVTANESDPAPADNTATAVTGVNAADLSVSATASPSGYVGAGTPLTYTLTVQNAGPNVTATGVTLTDTLPGGATFQTATASQGSCTQSGGTVTCALGSLAVGATATATIAVAAPSAGPTATDQATVSAVNPDWNPSNNMATVQTSVVGPGTLVLVNRPYGGPQGIAEDGAGNVYVAYQYSDVVDKTDPSGNTTTYAGTGGRGSSGDGGPATVAQLNQPMWLSFDAAGDLLIADMGNNEIRSVSPSGIITTVAGNGSAGYSGDGGAATSAQINQPQSVTGLAGGGFLLSDTNNNVVRKVDPSGKITTVAGNGIAGYSGDGGPATAAQLNEPIQPIMDSAGNLIISDCSNNVVRKVDPTGKISTIAGTGTSGFAGDGGPAIGAQFNCPDGLSLWAGSLYVADYGNGAIRRIDAFGNISTVVGQGVGGTFSRVTEMWPDASGRLYFDDWYDGAVYFLSLGPDLLSVSSSAPAGVALGQTFAYTLTVGNLGGAGTATGVSLSDPLPAGLTFVSATAGSGTCSQSGGTVTCALGQLAPGAATTATVTVTAPATGSGPVSNTTTVAATQPDITPGDNTATSTVVLNAADMSVTGTGSPAQAAAYSRETHTFTVSSGGSIASGVTLNATLTQNVAIQSVSASQGSCTSTGISVSCQLGTIGVGVTPTVSIIMVPPPTVPVVTDSATVASALVDPNPSNNGASVQTAVADAFGTVSTFAGGGSGGDGIPATSASLRFPGGVIGDGAGNIYIAELYGNRVRKVDPSGIITTYAGNGQAGYFGDGGPAKSAELNQPYWLSFDAAGDLLVADIGNNVIRSINPHTGTITTVAGNGTAGYTGDGGPATSAELNNAQMVRGLAGGGFLISDTSNNVVRKVDASGKITTIVGNGTSGFSGDGGPATSAELNSPQDIAVDPVGNLIIADCGNQRVRKVDATTGNISTIAGTGAAGYSGDGGPATSATFNCPIGLALSGGDILVSDYGNANVRMINPSGTITTIATASYRANEIWVDTAGDVFIADFAGRIDEALNAGPDLLNLRGSGPPFVVSGHQFSYTFNVANPGTIGPASGVTLSDHLPSGLTFVSATATQGTCTATSGTVACALGQLSPGAWDAVTITVMASSTPADVRNTATVSANEADPALGDNTAAVLSHLGEVDLSLSQTGPAQALVPLNQPVTFFMTIGSRGAASGVTLKDPLPSSLKFVSATPSQGTCSAASAIVTCALGAMADGGSATVTLKATPIAAVGPITSTATVSADQPDINPTDNTASSTIYVNPPTCGEVITANTTLSADIGPCWGDGVIIGADGITLNLNGHRILGDALRLDDMAGIRLPVRNFVTIENGAVSGFAEGIFFNSGGGNTVTNMNIHDNIGANIVGVGPAAFNPDFGDGILLQHSAANRILNNTITHNGIYDGVGIFGMDSNFNLLQGNTISKNTDAGNGHDGEGIATSSFLENDDPRRSNSLFENNFIGNTIVDNAAAGISNIANVDAQILNNDIERNGLESSTYPLNGIGLQPERQSTEQMNDIVENNKVVGNGNDGIEMVYEQYPVSGNLIKNNVVLGNNANQGMGHDLNDTSGDCTHNVWTGNTYSSSGGVSPACLASTNQLAGGSTPSSPARVGTAPASPRSSGNLLSRGRVEQPITAPSARGSGSVAAPALPAVSSSSAPPCGSLITASVTLTADIGPCPGTGLIVGADNITIDLGGHKIVGQEAGDGVSPGIYVFGHQGVTVKNGSISNFDAGVAVYLGAYDTITNLNIHDNIGPSQPFGTTTPIWYQIGGDPNGAHPVPVMSNGIAVDHSFAVQVLNNTVTHNGVYAGIGIYGVDAGANVVKGNTVTNTVGSGGAGGIGIDVTAAFEFNDIRPYLPIEANNVLANTVSGNQGAGIVSLGNRNGLIRGNVVQNNGVGVSGSPLDGIQLNFNSGGGASPGTIDTVLGNTVSGNGDNGIAVYSGGNTIQGNTATGDNVNHDGSFDLFDSHPTCDHNTWHGNTSGSAGFSPSCA